jgi:hypothetical protein
MVYLDGDIVDDLGDIERRRSPGRLDRLHAALEHTAAVWEAHNPGKNHKGIVGFYLDAKLPLLYVKSLVVTAGLAGHSVAFFAVRTDPGRIGLIHLATMISVPDDAAWREDAMAEPKLFLDIEPSLVTMSWHSHGLLTRPADRWRVSAATAGFAEGLGQMIDRQWRAAGSHKNPADVRMDWVILRMSDDAPLQSAIDALTGVYRPKRDVKYDGRTRQLPVFLALLAVGGPGSNASANLAKAFHLVPAATPSQEIQATIRAHYEELRQCYEAALVRHPRLDGMLKVRFTIGSDGSVTAAERMEETDLPDAEAVGCMLAVFRGLVFYNPEHKSVTVHYPVKFSPE